MFIDVHAIQTVPPSNINRDDTGSPKTAVFGGKLRARVSSQAWKRAMRTEFKRLLPAEDLGKRTKLAIQLVANRISEIRPLFERDRCEELAACVFRAAGFKVKQSSRAGEAQGAAETEYLVFIAASEVDGLAKLAVSWEEAGDDTDPSKPDKAMKNDVEKVFHGSQAVDIALFGRMLADAPQLNTDASAQVAHAISVDEVQIDYDYFTALDDCAPDDNAGAAMIESTAFDSSTLYRFATLDVASLVEQLGDANAAAEACAAFIEAFAQSMPTGKQNSFANRTLPSTLCVVARDSQPVNAASAFEVPVRATPEASIASQAARRLGDELAAIDRAYGTTPRWARVVCDDESSTSFPFAERASLRGLVGNLRQTVVEMVGEGQ